MRFIHATYNMLHNCIDVTTFDGYVLRIDCGKAKEGFIRTVMTLAFTQSIAKAVPKLK